MNNYDIIVVGAGCGGLTAAAFAVKEGKKVLLLEGQKNPGGVLTSFIRGRFEFEAALGSLRGFYENGDGDLSVLLKELGIRDNLPLTEKAEKFRIITKSSDGSKTDMVLPYGVENYIDAVSAAIPESREALENIFDIARETGEAEKAFALLGEKIGNSQLSKFKKEYGNFVRTAAYPVNDVTASLGLTKKATEIFNALWLLAAVDCDRLSFVHYASLISRYLESGCTLPKRRGYDISMALASYIEENGGEIRYSEPVQKFMLENGRISGVILKSGERIKCSHVIANCSPTTAYSKMMRSSDIPASALRRVNASKLGARNACVYIGLNRSAEELGITEQTVFVTETADTVAQFSLMSRIDTNNAFIAECPNVTDTGASPFGTCILRLSTFYTDNCWANVNPQDYYNEKDILAARLIAKYEDATGITIHNNIEELEVATPMTFARYTSAPKGVTNGYIATDWDGIVARILTEKNDNDIPGLRFCGGWGTQHTGVNACAASGRNALYATLDDIEKGGTADEK